MAYDHGLAERVRELLADKPGISEKAMFGGLSFLIDRKMFCGILGDDFVVRIDPNEAEKLLKKPHVRPMDFTGRPMKGYLYVSTQGYESDEELLEWINRSLKFTSSLPQKKKK